MVALVTGPLEKYRENKSGVSLQYNNGHAHLQLWPKISGSGRANRGLNNHDPAGVGAK